MRVICILATLWAPSAHAQLRPRRVGVDSYGEQASAADSGGNEMAELMAKLAKGGGMGGAGLSEMMNNPELAEMMNDPEAMQKMMAKGMEAMMGANPAMAEKLPEMMKGMEAMMKANPEVAELMKDPSKLQEKMAEVAELMNSDEGRAMSSRMMQEIESVLSDPEKLRQGLEQFSTNPMLKGLADAVPGLKEVLEDPDLMAKSIEEAQAAISQVGGFKGMQEKLAEMAGGEDGINPMASLLKAMAGGDTFEGLGADSNLQERVRGQLAAMLQGNEGAFASGDLDEY
ncbi:hypothetical protein AB1Y20_005229 [Prymnesium parvum]|uniref:STI1 domain-containing protein n=1 Tax=Prymnesium parvum TaxID=97485 RepID=A0AB34J5Y0_PRYPA|mmetsp:Transcript_38234/g.95094  ORF Transcript_38234/g.95094 Transcript_38234/m.95094 type:complete len:286 (+) Transcript_38234:196-1053(+)